MEKWFHLRFITILIKMKLLKNGVTKREKMNRIILIGNGFDLAHGLKTSYASFIDWYWGEWGKRLRSSDNKEEFDGLCLFKLNEEVKLHSWAYVWGWHYQRTNLLEPWNNHDVVELAKQDKNLCVFTITSYFFNAICNSIEEKDWVDIENVYYDYLSDMSLESIKPAIINKDLEIVRKYLINYLSDIQKGITEDLIQEETKEKMRAPIKKEDLSVGAMAQNVGIIYQFEQDRMKVSPDRILMLNFNYTSLADLYLPKSRNHIVNHIHGKLAEPDSVIFGYGDELDEDYKRIVNYNDNEYLRNIKSVKYLESPNYRNLLEFIESSPYQVYIMGHSCGNSDRTLLNTLFEHRNCVSIKPFYHKWEDGTDNYLELVQNISRNFTDMKLMRDRVVNKTFCETI